MGLLIELQYRFALFQGGGGIPFRVIAGEKERREGNRLQRSHNNELCSPTSSYEPAIISAAVAWKQLVAHLSARRLLAEESVQYEFLYQNVGNISGIKYLE